MSDDDLPDLVDSEETVVPAAAPGGKRGLRGGGGAVQTEPADPVVFLGGEHLKSGERKARKALAKLGLVRVTGVNRVVLKQARGVRQLPCFAGTSLSS